MSVESLTSIINILLPEPHAGLLAGIVFGTKATLSKSLYNDLVTTGTLHIVALSGMNITILASLVNLTLLRFISRRVASLLTIGLIVWFVWFVGPAPSIIRAAIMGTISLIAVIFGRQNWAILSWILAVGSMLLIQPTWIMDISFQLSALATLGIILFGNKKIIQITSEKQASISFYPSKIPILWALCSFLYSLVEDDLRVTLAAQVFTIPLIFLHFHRISLISPLTNILIGWTIAPLTVLGWVVSVLGMLWLPLGQIVAWISWLLLEYLVLAVSVTAKLPLASLGF